MKIRILGLLFLWTLAGCSPKPVVQHSLYNSTQGPSAGSLLLGVFKGTLPPGVETELSLYHPNLYTDEGTYILKTSPAGSNTPPLVTRGDWTMIRGDAADENASVYQLEPDHPEKSVYYLRVNSGEVRKLDQDEKEIKSKLNFTLTKIQSGP
jgi:hypothetical protein